MTTDTQDRIFHVRNTEKCFRFKPEAIENHAPPIKGIYELVTFDESQKPEIIFIGAAFEKTINDHLTGHLNGTTTPSANELLATHPNLYFDYLTELKGAKTPEDAQDIYWWLIQKNKPKYNDIPNIKNSGRPGKITVIEED